MAVSLGGNSASLPHRSLRRPALPNTHQKWPNSSLEERIVSCGTAKARYPQVLKSVGKAPEQYGAWDEDEDDEH
jgi:hypothetical protein